MVYGRGRNAARHWHTKNIRKFSYAFLGNRHLRSKSGLEGAMKWRLKHPATRYKKHHRTFCDVFCIYPGTDAAQYTRIRMPLSGYPSACGSGEKASMKDAPCSILLLLKEACCFHPDHLYHKAEGNGGLPLSSHIQTYPALYRQP